MSGGLGGHTLPPPKNFFSKPYVEMVRQEHPESERQQLAAALWHHAHRKFWV